VRDIARREAAFFARTEVPVPIRDIDAAVRVLKAVRTSLEEAS
jgi:hypothetical protein